MVAKKKEKLEKAPWMYDIIAKPVITEKSTLGSQYGQVTFRVPLTATKPQIKAAVETLFEVKVKKVNTSVSLGKTKGFQGRRAFRSDSKKAIITLESGQTIDVGTGL